jgi:hypothetical protein
LERTTASDAWRHTVHSTSSRFLDGKPAQESTVSINDVRDNMTDAELRTFIASAIAGTLSGGNGAAEPGRSGRHSLRGLGFVDSSRHGITNGP